MMHGYLNVKYMKLHCDHMYTVEVWESSTFRTKVLADVTVFQMLECFT